MKNYLTTKAAGFYPALAATVLALVALICYLPARGAVQNAILVMAAAVAVQVLLNLLALKIQNRTVMNLGVSVSAVLCAAGIMLSLPMQLDNLGYLVSGLYSVGDLQNYLLFLVMGVVALLLYLAASFMEQVKES